MSAHERVAIFWDYENCRSVSNLSGHTIVNSIRRIAHEFGICTNFRAYLELSEISQKSSLLRSELQCSGVSLIDCPHNGRKDVADKMILVDMLTYAIDNPAPATIILISGDRDFAYALSTLRLRRYRVVLVVPPGTVHVSLKSQASVLLDWNSDVLGKAGEDQSVDLTSRTTNERDSPYPQGAPSTPPSPMTSRSSGRLTDGDYDRRVQSWYAALGVDELAVTDTKDPDDCSERGTASRIVARQRSQSAGEPSHIRDPSHKKCNETAVSHRNTVSLQSPSNSSFAPGPGAVSPCEASLPPAYSGSAGMSASHPPAANVDQRPDSSQPTVRPQPSHTSRSLPVDIPVPGKGPTSAALRDDQSLDILHGPSVCISRSELALSQTRSPSFNLTDISCLPSPSVPTTGSSSISAMSSVSCSECSSVRDAAVMVSSEMSSATLVGDSVIMSYPTLPVLSAAVLSASTPACTKSTRCSTVNYTPGSGDCRPTLSIPRRHVPPAFKLLVDRLDRLRSKDILRPFRSIVSIDLVVQDKFVYQRAGMTKFEEYVAKAEKAGIVQLGGQDPRAWISLHPKWHGCGQYID